MDPEAAARMISQEARKGRSPTPRWVWILAVAVSLGCVIGLAIAWIEDRDVVPDKPLLQHTVVQHSGGTSLGLVVGIGLGIAIGSVMAVRRRKPRE